MDAWWHQHPWLGGIGVSVLLAVLSLAGAALVLVRLPADHFVRPPAPVQWRGPRRLLVLVARNVLGLVLIVLGVLLSLPGVPGQGLLTLWLGLLLTDLPGKRRLELRLVALRSVRTAIDRVRARFGRPPLLPPV